MKKPKPEPTDRHGRTLRSRMQTEITALREQIALRDLVVGKLQAERDQLRADYDDLFRVCIERREERDTARGGLFRLTVAFNNLSAAHAKAISDLQLEHGAAMNALQRTTGFHQKQAGVLTFALAKALDVKFE